MSNQYGSRKFAVREVEITEAGQDHGEEYVTVRLYANLLDYTVHAKTGQVIAGSSSDPVKFVEYWTFTRNVGEKNWVLGGITQEEDREKKVFSEMERGAEFGRPFF